MIFEKLKHFKIFLSSEKIYLSIGISFGMIFLTIVKFTSYYESIYHRISFWLLLFIITYLGYFWSKQLLTQKNSGEIIRRIIIDLSIGTIFAALFSCLDILKEGSELGILVEAMIFIIGFLFAELLQGYFLVDESVKELKNDTQGMAKSLIVQVMDKYLNEYLSEEMKKKFGGPESVGISKQTIISFEEYEEFSTYFIGRAKESLYATFIYPPKDLFSSATLSMRWFKYFRAFALAKLNDKRRIIIIDPTRPDEWKVEKGIQTENVKIDNHNYKKVFESIEELTLLSSDEKDNTILSKQIEDLKLQYDKIHEQSNKDHKNKIEKKNCKKLIAIAEFIKKWNWEVPQLPDNWDYNSFSNQVEACRKNYSKKYEEIINELNSDEKNQQVKVRILTDYRNFVRDFRDIPLKDMPPLYYGDVLIIDKKIALCFYLFEPYNEKNEKNWGLLDIISSDIVEKSYINLFVDQYFNTFLSPKEYISKYFSISNLSTTKEH